MSAKRAWFQRRTAAAIATLCLLGQLVGLVHLLVVQHVRCATHGEVVHVAPGPRAAEHEHAGKPIVELVPDDGAARAGEHEHCAWLSEVRDRPQAAAPILATARVATVSPALPPRDRVVAPTRPLYRLAPKSSPPSAPDRVS